ncbi:MAG: hypothetical protein DRJ38_00820 [Thermoprotei archaeon]|nr:MAG: hypothetical protein DRJ38_00820 [Thermoprotei archaeon]
MIHETFIIISVVAGISAIASSYYLKLHREEKFKNMFFLSLLTSIILIPSIISVLSRSVFGDRGLAVVPGIISVILGLVALLIYVRE